MTSNARLNLGLVIPLSLVGLFVLGDFLGTPISLGILAVAFAMAALGRFASGAVASVGVKALFSMAVGCVSLIGADLVLRRYYAEQIFYRPEEIYQRRLTFRLPIRKYAANISVQCQTYGDAAAVLAEPRYRQPREIQFQTDRYGYRNAPGQDEGPIDVIVLGDSFAAGCGTTQEQTFAARLENEYGHRVYNLAVAGNGPWSEHLNLLLEIDRLETTKKTVVLWAFFSGNDLDDEYLSADPRTLLPIGWGESLATSVGTWRKHSPLQFMVNRLTVADRGAGRQAITVKQFVDGRTFLFWNQYTDRAHRSAEEVWQHRNLPLLKQTIAAMRRLADRKGIQVKAALIPSSAEVYDWLVFNNTPWSSPTQPSGFAVVLAEVLHGSGMDFVDLKPRMIAESKRAYEEAGELLWWSDDSHVNGLGHQVIADGIHESLLTGPAYEVTLRERNASDATGK